MYDKLKNYVLYQDCTQDWVTITTNHTSNYNPCCEIYLESKTHQLFVKILETIRSIKDVEIITGLLTVDQLNTFIKNWSAIQHL